MFITKLFFNKTSFVLFQISEVTTPITNSRSSNNPHDVCSLRLPFFSNFSHVIVYKQMAKCNIVLKTNVGTAFIYIIVHTQSTQDIYYSLTNSFCMYVIIEIGYFLFQMTLKIIYEIIIKPFKLKFLFLFTAYNKNKPYSLIQ